ncbi:hypothetical protein M501DRAFT_995144 [Patellaria atrata CBS 101060]|uniref:ATP synthase F0 subunit 8 n=1 Tax=Patellaria atrata CBS 101060 TaxID=1346257 RepID=A0A9P4S8A2_9PEZI|nr:hypothetical protein M501DRAFT_995144 [Patellaria atrata CBS 101060]
MLAFWQVCWLLLFLAMMLLGLILRSSDEHEVHDVSQQHKAQLQDLPIKSFHLNDQLSPLL